MEYLLVAAAMLLSWGCAAAGLYLLSGAVLVAAGIALYGIYYKKSGKLLDPAALFSIAWIGGAGVSALKLSRLQTDWETLTWVCFFAAWCAFALGNRFARSRRRGQNNAVGQRRGESVFVQTAPDSGSAACSRTAGRILNSMLLLTAVSLGCFFFEAQRLGYVPLFTVDTPHAYSYFHVSGVHYFTVSCVLVPALFVLYLEELRQHCACLREADGALSGQRLFWRLLALGYGGRLCTAFFCTIAALLIPVLCVSRFQLIFAVVLAAFVKLMLSGMRLSGRRLLFLAALFLLCMVPVYVGLTVARAHDVTYLNGIFEMKDPRTPIFFTQPYIYIANNFDNFNCLVRDLPADGHTFGLRMLFPLWALSGLKFLFPALVSFPLYVTKAELTTVTLFYDAFYDFGLLGIVLFGLLLGFAAGKLFLAAANCRNMQARPALLLIFAQLCFYLLFSFFTTWFSNPTTWFYLALSLLFYFYLAYDRHSAERRRTDC